MAFLLGTDGTLYYNSVPVGPLDTWNSRFAPFQASDWILANGTASFETVQQNVQDLFILTETADVAPALESRVDNIALVPLPTAFILFGSALTGLGVIGCHGRATSKRKSG